MLYLRCYINNTSLWRPIGWRRYTYSEGISTESEQWFNTQTTEVVEQRFGQRGVGDGKEPEICVGVTTKIRSSGADYLPALVGSLFKDLEPRDRDRMVFIPFFLDPNYLDSPSYQTLAKLKLADRLVTPLTNIKSAKHRKWKAWYDEAKSMPIAWGGLDRQENLDFSYLMDQCLETRAKYILLLEDDTVARGDWLHQILEGTIPSIEAEAPEDWLYSLPFLASAGFGWELKDVWNLPVVAGIITVYLIAVLALSGWKSSQGKKGNLNLPQSINYNQGLSKRKYFRWYLLLVPLAVIPHIAIFFVQGKVAAVPVPAGLSVDHHWRGRGTQAILFNRENAQDCQQVILDVGGSDNKESIHKYSKITNRPVLLWQPSLFQHTGTSTSKPMHPMYHRDPLRIYRNYDFELAWH
jgi:hypothetical protein